MAVTIDGLSHRYGSRNALENLSFAVGQREVFGLLGPNGGGKTTLFRILSTLLPLQSGRVSILGLDLQNDDDAIRRRIGVTFQSPSLDDRLTVFENLKHQASLYGLSGRTMRLRLDEMLDRFGLSDRRSDRVQSLSGGLKRRVEIAKGLLHSPQLLLLDEPSTGLDPGGRLDMWRDLERLRTEDGVTVLLTTHLMEEADRCDRLGLLDRGRLVAIGGPDELRSELGGDCVTVQCEQPRPLAAQIAGRFGIEPAIVEPTLRIECENGPELIGDLMRAFPDEIQSLSIGKPTLEDVFVARTGHQFWTETGESNGN